MKGNAIILERYLANRNAGIAISSVTAAELYYGVFNSSQQEKNGINLTNFFVGLSILDFDSGAAIEYGRIRAQLRKKGTPIGQMDMLIAAHAKSRDMTLVTNNTCEFERVEDLNIEDWLPAFLH
jgi:tRNA(fMet)-specific endonuclease VapC